MSRHNMIRYASAVATMLLTSVPLSSQAQIDSDYSEWASTQDSYVEIDVSAEHDTVTVVPTIGAGPGDATGVSDFTICDTRDGETGRRINISGSGLVISRNVRCD